MMTFSYDPEQGWDSYRFIKVFTEMLSENQSETGKDDESL